MLITYLSLLNVRECLKFTILFPVCLQGPLKCDVFLRKCLHNKCSLHYEGGLHSIHFLSKITCGGDEIGWDFVSLVKSSKISFTAFCDEMTRRYKTNNILSAPFMSTATFVKWIFSWIAQMKIDFRQHIDPWCKYKPNILACDGTHVGVALKNLKLDKPVTESESTAVTKPAHKR